MTPSEITSPATPARVSAYPNWMPASEISATARIAQIDMPNHATMPSSR